jgi:hypothetical protein
MAGMPRENFRRTTGLAIEMLTALYDDPDSKRFSAERIAQLRDEDLPDLCVGLLDVAVLALGDLSDETGTTPQEWLQDLALQVQSDS